MGGKGDYQEPASARMASQLAERLFQETDPLRRGLIGRSERFLFGPQEATPAITEDTMLPVETWPRQRPRVSHTSPFRRGTGAENTFLLPIPEAPGGGMIQRALEAREQPEVIEMQPVGPDGWDVTESPVFEPARRALESQYQTARENILSSTGASGGRLENMLADLEYARARDLGELSSRIAMDEYNRAFQLATGSTPTAALTNLSQIGMQQANAAAQAAAGKSAGTGSAIGGIGSTIAAALLL